MRITAEAHSAGYAGNPSFVTAQKNPFGERKFWKMFAGGCECRREGDSGQDPGRTKGDASHNITVRVTFSSFRHL